MSWFSSYLFNRKQYVAIDGQSSEMQSISCGVPQGSILGPLIFILLINDIEFNVRLCKIILYARPFLEESCTRVPKHSCDFVCASDRSGKDSQAPFIPWKSKLQ